MDLFPFHSPLPSHGSIPILCNCRYKHLFPILDLNGMGLVTAGSRLGWGGCGGWGGWDGWDGWDDLLK
jgi:hypothetical protein